MHDSALPAIATSSRRQRAGALALVAALSLVASIAQAQQASATIGKASSVTVYGGYRGGGELTDVNSGESVDFKSAGSFAVAVDIGLTPQTQVEIFYGHQRTSLASGVFTPAADNLTVAIDYYHIGGTYFFETVGRGGYVVGGLGATSLRPDRDGLETEIRFSGNLGIGYMLPLGAHMGLRFEARGYATLIDNNGGFFCGGNVGCVISIKGEALVQGEALVGLSVRF